MDAITKLQELYALRDKANEQIAAIEHLLGADPVEMKVRRTRGPNKPKEPPLNTL